MKYYFTYFLYFLFAVILQAQNLDTDTLFKPEPNELLKLPIKEETGLQTQIAGQTNFVVREAPAAVTIITQQQLLQWGITDLIEIFSFVPGFEVNFDLGNSRGVSVRGNWGGEAKVLFMIDGMQMNELSYGFVSLGGHFSVTAIEKIEIIRGPGSALYGGLAGLAVINITTKNGVEKNTTEARLATDISQGLSYRQLSEISITRKVNNHFSYFIHTSLQKSKISNRFLDLPMGRANYADSSNVDNRYVHIGLQYQQLRVRAMYDEFKVRRTLDIYSYDKYNDFTGTYMTADYTWKINPKLTILPEISYKIQEPWNAYGGSENFYAMLIKTTQSMLRVKYDFNEKLEFTLGGQYYNWDSQFKNDTVLFFNNKNRLNIDNLAIFGEISYQYKYANVVAGARYEKTQYAGEAFVPRFSLTKAFKKFHYKFLFAEAFKVPVVSNLQLATAQMRPENIRYGEIELGYKLNEKFSFSVNSFIQNIRNIIIFSFDASVMGGYENKGISNTVGIESQFNYQSKNFQAFLQYSFYKPTVNNSDISRVPERNDLNQGVAPHKITLHTHTKLNKNLFLTANVHFFSERFHYVPSEFVGDTGLRSMHKVTLFDVILWWKNAITKVADLQFYVRDAGNEQFSYTAAYKVDLYPLPAPARTFGVKLLLNLK
jgi:outer membrane cobalamin receptor